LKVTSPAGSAVESVSFLSDDGDLDVASDPDGLTVNVPPDKPGNYKVAFRHVQ